MENYLETFSRFFMYSFVRIEEDYSILFNFVEAELKKSKDKLLNSKLKIAIGKLGENNKNLILEMKKYHDLFYLLHDVILKNQSKLLEIQEKIKTINNPSFQSEFETLVAVFENEVLGLEAELENITNQLQENIIHNSIINDFEVSEKNFLNTLNQHNKNAVNDLKNLSENVEQFENKTIKIAQYENKVQELYNQIMLM
ncbi:MAG TPA: hypothetical protein DCZ80_04605 [Legionellales bacterium]|nr:hypothetical protein [Legionellales bacterium]